jgi:hypothetical protein
MGHTRTALCARFIAQFNAVKVGSGRIKVHTVAASGAHQEKIVMTAQQFAGNRVARLMDYTTSLITC